ncbi:cobaltochelatase subunit CobN [Roseibium denhamense]|uniref:Cobaltochelatase subunit CobN n=1 Tax=Roseibium denhamense TaxID=76305 RepID=A0ABY1PFP1_9HYPH|nr:cobaltochelatase subunit CobN [Roseibium denhamense]MTI07826.1 cobaltochelatase subunit CobN [Roseibium denhamense]SMP31875.1 cobaltochelatase CobN subunit [Roseibium denhamense]
MHILASQTRRIDDGGDAVDLSQQPADILFLSAADTELGSFAAAHARLGPDRCSLRLANLMALSHPYSVDLYAEQTVRGSKLVILRVLGGVEYWRYGLERFQEEARASQVDLIVIPGDDKWDEALTSHSTREMDEVRRFWRYCVEGGAENYANALQYAAYLAGRGEEPAHPVPLPRAGIYLPGQSASDLETLKAFWADPSAPVAAITFYRALVQGSQTAPVDALVAALKDAGVNALPVYVSSLKEAESIAVLDALFESAGVDVVLNGTAFAVSKAGAAHQPTPLDKWGKPVLQVVFSSSSKEGWDESDQGLSIRDLAMHVVLPEIDGRLLTRAVSFKEEGVFDEATQSTQVKFTPVPDRMRFVADLAANWAQLGLLPAKDKKTALILANYPNKDGRLANGVGLDTPASCVSVLKAMKTAGFETGGAPDTSAQLMERLMSGVTNALDARDDRSSFEVLPLADYQADFARLPAVVRDAVRERWGAPQADPHMVDGNFRLALHRFGNQVVGIQPARGYNIDPKETYHDPDLVPPHHYFAFYFWIRKAFGAHAVIHLGKHGNLEWLPGKALALSEGCYPEAVLGPTPNIYPFIVNDPGEGAQAKRRTSAVIVDHLTPPLTRAESHGVAEELETLLDEHYLASGVDPRRLKALTRDILDAAARHGLDKDIGITGDMDEDTRLARLDAHLCDLKELQIRDGLHILGQSPDGHLLTDLLTALVRVPRGAEPHQNSLQRALASDLQLIGFDPLDCDFSGSWTGARPEILAAQTDAPWRSNGDTVERLELLAHKVIGGEVELSEIWPDTQAVLREIETSLRPSVTGSGKSELDAVLTALSGGFVPPGPSGAPSRGRPDVLPTGKNFYSVDVRAVPTETAWRLGQQSASLVAERYFQEEGEWPASLVLTCWGTANMRTGGDDIAQALALIGARPVWEQASGRVTGFEILKLSELGRPRIDVTLRVSGFFRDAFPHQMDLFDSAVRAVGALEEPAEANPVAARMKAEAAKLAADGVAPEEAQRRAGFRVFGSKPGAYGAGLQALIDEGIWDERGDFAEAFLTWGGYAYGGGVSGQSARGALEGQLASVDAVLHNQDNREHDLLDSDDYYQFEGGLSATVDHLKGETPKVYHNDHSRPERPVVRSLSEEIGRVVRGRAANPKWIRGVMRHGYKGAFEMVATLDYLFAFAATTRAVGDHHFDQLYAAYLDDEAVRDFLQDANPAGYQEMLARFQEALDRGLWTPRRNSTHAALSEFNKTRQSGETP